MRVKSYKLFKEENTQSPGEQLEFQLREFESKKGNLKNLIIDNIDTDKDITKAYQDIVEENPFLSRMGQILNLEARMKKKELAITDMRDTISKLRSDLNSVSSLSDQEDRESQTQRLKEQMSEKEEKTKEFEQDIKDLEEQYKDEQEQLEEFIREKKRELDEIKKNSI